MVDMTLRVYGYWTGCEACDGLKELLEEYGMPFDFIPVTRGSHPFKTVPMIFGPHGDWIGNYDTMKKSLEG